MNKEIEDLILSLPGWTSIKKANSIYDAVKSINAKTVIEIGTFSGRATVALGLACKETGGTLYSIDPYSFEASLEGKNNPDHDKFWVEMDYDAIEESAKFALKEAKVAVTHIKKRSQDAINDFRFEGGQTKVDLVYIDGNPSPEVTMLDIENYGNLLADGGVLILNDSNWGTKVKAKRQIIEMGFVVANEETDVEGSTWTTYQKTDNESYRAIIKAQADREASPEHKIQTLFKRLEGWMTEKKAKMIYDIIVETKAQVSVEIGFFGMRGSVAMALAHKEVGGKHWGLDPLCVSSAVEGDNDPENNEYWEKIDYEYILRSGLQVLIDEELTQWCNILRLKSEEAFYLFTNIDVLHIDGSHSSVAAEGDVQYYAPLMSKTGHVIFDDSQWAQTQHAQELLINYGFQEIHCEDAEDGTQWKIYKKLEE